MVVLTKNSSNTAFITLYDLVTLNSPKFLFEFENEQYHTKSYCIPTDIGTELSRGSEFVITETTNPNALSGQVELLEGSYILKIYEQLSTTNLNPSGLNCVKTDICQVIDSTSYVNTAYTGASTTNTAYEG